MTAVSVKGRVVDENGQALAKLVTALRQEGGSSASQLIDTSGPIRDQGTAIDQWLWK